VSHTFLNSYFQMAGIADDLEPRSADDMEQVLKVYSTPQPKVSNAELFDVLGLSIVSRLQGVTL
jgi:hypothetical protein